MLKGRNYKVIILSDNYQLALLISPFTKLK